MRRLLFLLLALVGAHITALGAFAEQNPPTISTPDPNSFAATVAGQMQKEGMAPIRATFEQMFSANNNPLPANIEGFLVTWERYIAHREASVVQKIDDVTVGGTVRQIYYYHYFGGSGWIFTRFDFVRTGDNQWALSQLALEDQWSKIAQTTSPLPPAH